MARRGRDFYIKRRWRGRRVVEAEADPLKVPDEAPALASQLPPIGDADSRAAEAARAALLAAAEEVLKGRWWIFDRLREDVASGPDWFLDPLTGVRAPGDRSALEVNYRDEELVGNIKYVWELSRHHHVSVLAAAYYLSGEERYAEAAAAQLRSWWNANPFLTGVHWTSGIELGVRLIAWIWTRRLLQGWAGAPELFEQNRVFLQQLHHHQDYLASLPSYGSSANNHVLAEAAGLFAAACAFPYFAESESWRRKAAVILRHEIPAQTFASGLNREMATDYQGFVMEIGLVAALEGEAAGHSLGTEVWQQIRNMTDALAALLDVAGRPPRQGDADDGIGLLLDAPEYQRWQSLLHTGEVLFGACDWWPGLTRRDLRTPIWTAIAKAPAELGSRPLARPVAMDDAGLALLLSAAGTAEEIWCRCDHGPHGFLSIAAHAHADALAIEVRHGGVDVLADPGTLCYQGEPAWRTLTRSTLGHNTLELAGADQSVSGGPFLWTRHANSTLEHVAGLSEGPRAEWRASHDGYERLDPPATHRRAVCLERDDRRLVIDDSLDCAGSHACRLAFHLGPAIDCELDGDEARLTWVLDEAVHRATLRLPPQLSWAVVRAQQEPPLGWYAGSFRGRTPSITLVGSGRLSGGENLVTQLQFASETEVKSVPEKVSKESIPA